MYLGMISGEIQKAERVPIAKVRGELQTNRKLMAQIVEVVHVNSKDVAVVHWTESGKEKLASVGTIQLLSQMIEFCEKKGYTYYVCMTKLDTIIPVRSQKPDTAFKVPSEYVDKVEVTERQQGALQRSREPTEPLKLDHHAHAEKVRKIYQQVQNYQ